MINLYHKSLKLNHLSTIPVVFTFQPINCKSCILNITAGHFLDHNFSHFPVSQWSPFLLVCWINYRLETCWRQAIYHSEHVVTHIFFFFGHTAYFCVVILLRAWSILYDSQPLKSTAFIKAVKYAFCAITTGGSRISNSAHIGFKSRLKSLSGNTTLTYSRFVWVLEILENT